MLFVLNQAKLKILFIGCSHLYEPTPVGADWDSPIFWELESDGFGSIVLNSDFCLYNNSRKVLFTWESSLALRPWQKMWVHRTAVPPATHIHTESQEEQAWVQRCSWVKLVWGTERSLSAGPFDLDFCEMTGMARRGSDADLLQLGVWCNEWMEQVRCRESSRIRFILAEI